MSKVTPFRQRNQPADGAAVDSRSQAIFDAVKGLLRGLPPTEREQLLRHLADELRPIPVPQAGDVLGLVVQLLPLGREWTVKEIKDEVKAQSAPITDKELYNALGYLTRKQHIERLGYGRYVINGVPLVTTDVVGGQPSITEEDLDN